MSEDYAQVCRRCGAPGAVLHFPGGYLCQGGCDPNPIIRPKELDPDEGMDEIALRELVSTLRTRLAEVEADAAVLREALLDEREEIIRGGRHHVEERRMGVIDRALSTNAGKSLLERLKEAQWLVANAIESKSPTLMWLNRRDAFLNTNNNQKDKE